MLLTEIDTKKIPGKMNDRVKLHTYLSPGDLLVLWNSFKVACTLFSPEAAADTVRITNNLCGFWKTMLDKARDAVEAGDCINIYRCRGLNYFFLQKSKVVFCHGSNTDGDPFLLAPLQHLQPSGPGIVSRP